jgi:hypothetical protein
LKITSLAPNFVGTRILQKNQKFRIKKRTKNSTLKIKDHPCGHQLGAPIKEQSEKVKCGTEMKLLPKIHSNY